jgi:hypothetical protein
MSGKRMVFFILRLQVIIAIAVQLKNRMVGEKGFYSCRRTKAASLYLFFGPDADLEG